MLVAPFVTYAVAAFVLFLMLRPVLQLLRFDRVVSNPPLVTVSIYVLVLAILVVML